MNQHEEWEKEKNLIVIDLSNIIDVSRYKKNVSVDNLVWLKLFKFKYLNIS